MFGTEHLFGSYFLLVIPLATILELFCDFLFTIKPCLYKFFKYYFAEQEKRFIDELKIIKDKLTTYKDLCKTILSQNNSKEISIDSVNAVLIDKRVTLSNNIFKYIFIKL